MLKQIVCKWTLFWINIFQCVLFYFWAFFLQVSCEKGHRCCFKQTFFFFNFMNLKVGIFTETYIRVQSLHFENECLQMARSTICIHFSKKACLYSVLIRHGGTDYSFPLIWYFTCKFIALSILQFDTNLSTVTTVNYIFSCKVII